MNNICYFFLSVSPLTPIISLTDQLPPQPEIPGDLLCPLLKVTAESPEKSIGANVFIQNRPQKAADICNGRVTNLSFTVLRN